MYATILWRILEMFLWSQLFMYILLLLIVAGILCYYLNRGDTIEEALFWLIGTAYCGWTEKDFVRVD